MELVFRKWKYTQKIETRTYFYSNTKLGSVSKIKVQKKLHYILIQQNLQRTSGTSFSQTVLKHMDHMVLHTFADLFFFIDSDLKCCPQKVGKGTFEIATK